MKFPKGMRGGPLVWNSQWNTYWNDAQCAEPVRLPAVREWDDYGDDAVEDAYWSGEAISETWWERRARLEDDRSRRRRRLAAPQYVSREWRTARRVTTEELRVERLRQQWDEVRVASPSNGNCQVCSNPVSTPSQSLCAVCSADSDVVFDRREARFFRRNFGPVG